MLPRKPMPDACDHLTPEMAATSAIRSKAVPVPEIVPARSLRRRCDPLIPRLSVGWWEEILNAATEVVSELSRLLDGNGPVPLAGNVADVGLRDPEGLRDTHLRDARQRDRFRHAVRPRRRPKNRELLLGEHP